MAKVFDIPAEMLVERLATQLRDDGLVEPEWTAFVKTGAHADRPPHRRDWWHVRCASILRKIYMHGPVGINGLRKKYGGGRPSGYGAAHHRMAGGAIIRNAVHGLEGLGLVAQAKGGRVVTSAGMKKMDALSTQILKEMVEETPSLKAYR